MEKLAASRVAVFGVGGVGGYVVEGLVRSGIGALDLVDHDTVDITNLNISLDQLQENLKKNVSDMEIHVMHEDIFNSMHRI